MERCPRTVALLAYDRLCTFEFGIMVELFGLPRPELDPWYRLCVCGLEPGPLRASGGIRVEAPFRIGMLDRVGTIVVPGWRDIRGPVPEALLRKLRRAHDEGARILSVCSGAFVLAAAGLLDGKRATTHWKYAEELARRYPEIEVDPDVLYVDEGSVITSAGSAAGIDMALHLIRRDFGAAAANTVARRLVVPPHRDGGQKQFIATPIEARPSNRDDDSLAHLLDALRAALDEDHTVASMARQVGLSPRTFARRFRQVTGTTPHRWLQHERVRAAQSLLETTGLGLEAIATRIGFTDTQLMRLHFKRVVGMSPTAYQRSFRAAEAPAAQEGSGTPPVAMASRRSANLSM